MGVPVADMSEDKQLIFQDGAHCGSVLTKMDTLRHAGDLCDCVLRVANGAEFKVHRAVLATASPHFMSMFKQDPSNEQLKSYKVPEVNAEILEVLLHYAYTGRLFVSPNSIKEVYRAAIELKFTQVATICAHHLIRTINLEDCLEVREFFNQDPELTSKVDDYIQDHLSEMKTMKHYVTLPQINLKIFGHSRDASPDAPTMARLIIDWMVGRPDVTKNGSMESTLLRQHENVLFLSDDNYLIEAEKVQEISKTDAVQDFVKICRKYCKNLSNGYIPQKDATGSHSNPQNAIRLVACEQNSNVLYSLLLSIQGHIHHITVRMQMLPSKNGTYTSSSSSEDEEATVKDQQIVSTISSFEPLADMSQPRCGIGLAVLDGKLVAVGGNDRGECLNSVECYDIQSNLWSPLPPMLCPRGRFECTVINGNLYACGGSDGRRELNSMECFDGESWKSLPRIAVSKMVSLFVIGGNNGTSAQKSCEMYDPETQKWCSIADLNVGRSQAAVCSHKGLLYAFGGTDSWNCFSSVEVYNPTDNKWSYVSSMSQAKRGAAAAVFRGKIYIVGGSNGACSLSSVEIYDTQTDSWQWGPNLKNTRANAGLAVCAGRLYSVGGYGGNNEFLSSLELLEADDDSQWCTYLKTCPAMSDSDPDH